MIKIDVIVSDEVAGLFPFQIPLLQKYVVKVIQTSDFSECDINIVFIDDKTMSELNEKYKGTPGSTDVLSFSLSEEDSDVLEGEVYVSLQSAKEQSLGYDIPFEEEIVRLVTHGLLHLIGRVHDTEENYKSMVEDTEHHVKSFFADGDIL